MSEVTESKPTEKDSPLQGHSKQGKMGLRTCLFFIPSYPADLRFSYFTGHLGLIKISFKDYKALVFWKGVGLGYCACEMISSPTSYISLLSKMDLGRKSIKQQQLSKLLSLI